MRIPDLAVQERKEVEEPNPRERDQRGGIWSAPKTSRPARISIHTHQQARRLTMSADVWQDRHPRETSASSLVPPQRFETGADRLLPTSVVGRTFLRTRSQYFSLHPGLALPPVCHRAAQEWSGRRQDLLACALFHAGGRGAATWAGSGAP